MSSNLENEENGKLDPIWKFLRLTIVFGIGFIFIVGIKAFVFGTVPPCSFFTNFRYYAVAVGTGLLVAGACCSIGGLMGFLFGIPRLLNAPNVPDNLKFKNQIMQNDNLVQISDWITKIIVGVGLTQLYQIPTSLMSLGTYLSPAFSNNNNLDESAKIIAIVIVLYFLVVGFLCSYLWTRLYFSKMLAHSQDEVDAILQKLEDKTKEVDIKAKELEEQKEEVEKQSDKANNFKNKTDELINMINEPPQEIEEVKQTSRSLQKDYIDEMIKNAEEKLKQGLMKNKEIDDPQKGMWGGASERNNRKLGAHVIIKSQGLYQIFIELISTDTVNHPLEDSEVVLFALHNTWKVPYRIVNIETDKAALTVLSYGSFTIGAFADKGATELELDLAELPGVTDDFKNT